MIVRIKRQEERGSVPYWQSFIYDGPKNVTVSAVLEALNYTDDLYDAEGKPASRIRWECSCMQIVCGGCAMVINGVPALACGTFVDKVKGDELLLEPLSKFPVIADLVVDRSIIYENLNQAQAYLEEHAVYDSKQYAHQYSVAKCLKCGLCLEVCPNYRSGGKFFGPVFANESYLLTSQTKTEGKRLTGQYKEHFQQWCSKALSCQTVCPAGIETLTSIFRMNRKR